MCAQPAGSMHAKSGLRSAYSKEGCSHYEQKNSHVHLADGEPLMQ